VASRETPIYHTLRNKNRSLTPNPSLAAWRAPRAWVAMGFFGRIRITANMQQNTATMGDPVRC